MISAGSFLKDHALAETSGKRHKKGPIPKNKAFLSAHEWIRTTTLIKAPPPQETTGALIFNRLIGYRTDIGQNVLEPSRLIRSPKNNLIHLFCTWLTLRLWFILVEFY